ncbi:MAG: TIGR00297 family protein [Cyanobacteriota bacterium]|jgi:uncharacterized protein (TIGR00297 family)
MTEFTLANPWLTALLVNGALGLVAWLLPKKLLTLQGYLHAGILGIGLWGTLGWRGYLVILTYFILGSAVTRLGFAQKERLGIAEGRSGLRGPENVWGSAATALACGLLTLICPESWFPFLTLGYVASLSAKLADTTASEVGKAYGQRTFLITTLQPVPKGTEGAVSLEGTLAGLGGGLVLALTGWGVGLITPWGVVLATVAAFVANTLESLIGAALQTRWSWLTNELVNGVNTALGALAAVGFALLGG